MKRSEIIAEGKAIKGAVASARRALDAIEARVDGVVAALSAAEPVGVPTQIEYNREKVPAPPKPVLPQNGEGEHETFQATTLHVMDDGEKKTFKVKGGQWKKWGVFIWPEVLLSEFGIDGDELKPGMYEFKHSCKVLMEGKNPKKVVGLA